MATAARDGEDPDLGDVLGDEDCRALLSIGVALAAAFTPGSGESEELAEAREFFGGDADVPDEIADDVEVMAEYFDVVVEAYENADVDFENPDDIDPQEAATKFGEISQEIQENVDQEAVDEASANLQEWGERELQLRRVQLTIVRRASHAPHALRCASGSSS